MHADKRRIRDYLAGERSTIQELDSWIRREIEICYPVLSREVDDICQVVHGKLIQNLRGDRFEHRSALKTYIGRMTHHTAIDCLRKEYRDRTVPEGSFLETRSTGDNLRPRWHAPCARRCGLAGGLRLRQIRATCMFRSRARC